MLVHDLQNLREQFLAIKIEAENLLGELTETQLKKHIVLVVDGKVLWAPVVQSTYDERSTPKDTLLAGSTRNGLSQEEVHLIISILRPAQRR